MTNKLIRVDNWTNNITESVSEAVSIKEDENEL